MQIKRCGESLFKGDIETAFCCSAPFPSPKSVRGHKRLWWEKSLFSLSFLNTMEGDGARCRIREKDAFKEGNFERSGVNVVG